MGCKGRVSIIVFLLSFWAEFCLYSKTQQIVPISGTAVNNLVEKDEDRQVQEKAIETLASMAMSLLNIGADSHNPQVIGSNVINILSSFINFVTFAMKNPGAVDLLNDEAFQDVLRTMVVRSIIEKYSDMTDKIV